MQLFVVCLSACLLMYVCVTMVLLFLDLLVQSKAADGSEDSNPVVTWYDDSHSEGGRMKASDVVSQILAESNNQYTAALEILEEREWHVNGRMICGIAGVIRDSHLASLETHNGGQAAVLQWHAERASGQWEDECVKMMDKLNDLKFCEACAMTRSSASVVSAVNSDDELDEVIQIGHNACLNCALASLLPGLGQ